ncbi:hypothetical protein SEPCBS119000_002716 [Sporothrix epigloea]|uniref:Cupin 2 conserved barrel domain-containing protein n=1 Tax=Sporothrix epigloea TaxID=1892477 RepID=A0ABP0DJF5_9PEZI
MAALLPILQEILPMLMPGPVHITRAEDLLGPPRDGGVVDDDSEAAADGDDEEDDEAEPLQGETAGTVEGGQDRGLDGQDAGSMWPWSRGRPGRPERPKKTDRRHNGVSLRDAIVHKSGSLCASVLTVKPQCSTVVFHNGEQEAIVYAVSGTATLATLPEDFDEYGDEPELEDSASTASTASHQRRGPEPAETTVHAGDFVFIPPWTEHQVRNEGAMGAPGNAGEAGDTGGGDDVVWVVVRNASEPTVVPLQGWGGEQAG